jgi:broad specificity phosphatase PhoE
MSHAFTFLRHGLSLANKDGIVQGQMDFPLSEEGLDQVNALADYWAEEGRRFELIISSPLARARSTAEVIGDRLRLPIEFDERWMERRLGTAQGKAYEEIESLFADAPHPSSHEPLFEHGESEWDLFLRAAGAVQDLVRRPAGDYLVVAHGAILAAAFRSILGISPSTGRVRPVRISFENTGYSLFLYESETARWSLQKHNVTHHLPFPDSQGAPVDE